MKKIINGKKYDTETATRIGEWRSNYICGDFSYCSEELYQKKTGECFLYVVAPPRSRSVRLISTDPYTCSYIGGKGIKPLTVDEAKEWVENHLDADTYESVFGECEE